MSYQGDIYVILKSAPDLQLASILFSLLQFRSMFASHPQSPDGISWPILGLQTPLYSEAWFQNNEG